MVQEYCVELFVPRACCSRQAKGCFFLRRISCDVTLGQSKSGLHAFRRFRTTWLRKNRTPEDLIRFWLGHAVETVTDGHSKLRDDTEYRREVADQVGLGFEIPAQALDVVPNEPSLQLAVAQESAA
jgi:hypothetical protein